MGEGDQVREDQAGVRRATASDRLVLHENDEHSQVSRHYRRRASYKKRLRIMWPRITACLTVCAARGVIGADVLSGSPVFMEPTGFTEGRRSCCRRPLKNAAGIGSTSAIH